MELPMGLSTKLYEAPRLVIERQPKKRGYRFRYKSEGETHGGIPGEPDPGSGSKKFYPTVKIQGYQGQARIVVTLVTANQPYQLHAHSMIVNREPMKGYCIFEMSGTSNVLELKNIAIQHAVKERLTETLMDRILQDNFINQFGWNSALKVGQTVQDVDFYASILEDRDETSQFLDRSTAKAIAGHELQQLEKKAKDLGKTMAMNSCRLCFQAFLQDQRGKYTQVLDRIFSDEIIDGKTKEGAMLKIIRLSAVVSSVSGGDEVWLLADKLNADDVEVRFFKQDKSTGGKLEWESFGEFSKSDVYKQAVLIFRTPKYKDQNVEQPVKVFLQLRRKKDRTCTSVPTAFTYKPKKFDRYGIGEKRKKTIPDNFMDALPQKSTLNLSNINFGDRNHATSSIASNSISLPPFMMTSASSTTVPNTAAPRRNFMVPSQTQQGVSQASGIQQPMSSNQSMIPNMSNLLANRSLGDSLENLPVTDSFLNQILDSQVKEEPIDNTPTNYIDSAVGLNGAAGVGTHQSFNSFLQTFTAEIENSNSSTSMWDQNSLQGTYNDLKSMEE